MERVASEAPRCWRIQSQKDVNIGASTAGSTVQQRLETGQCQRAANSRTKDRHCTSAGEVSVVDDVRDNGIVSSDRGTAVHIVLQLFNARDRQVSMGDPMEKVFRCSNVLSRCNPLITALRQFVGESFKQMTAGAIAQLLDT
jgi:hypothetical protein